MIPFSDRVTAKLTLLEDGEKVWIPSSRPIKTRTVKRYGYLALDLSRPGQQRGCCNRADSSNKRRFVNVAERIIQWGIFGKLSVLSTTLLLRRSSRALVWRRQRLQDYLVEIVKKSKNSYLETEPCCWY